MKSGKSMKKEKFIWTAKVGDKGQIVIPKEARDVFNIKNGDSLLLLGDTDKGIAIVKNEDYLKFAQAIFDAHIDYTRDDYTASLVKLNIDERISARRAEALSRGIPVADDETLNFLLLMLDATKPKRILEIGTAVGLSGSAMLLTCKNAHLTTIEKDEDSFNQAKNTFESFGVSD